MAITFVAAGASGDNGAAGSGNPTAPGIPAGMAAGDFMLCVVHGADNVTVSTPAGWTLKQAQNAGTALRQTIFWRRWVTGDTAPTIAHTAGDACQARIYGYRGVSTSAADPIEAIATQTGTASATVTAASITTVSDGAAVVGAWGMEVTGNTSGSPTWASYSGTNPTFAEIGDNAVDNLNANELAAGVAWGICTPAGTSTGTRTAVVSTAAATPTNNIGTLLALTAAVSSGAPILTRIANRFVGPMALRQRFRLPQLFGFISQGASKSITPDLINATSGVTASVTKLAQITPAGINATSAVAASVVKLAAIKPAAITSTSTVTATVVKRTAVTPSGISSTSSLTASLVAKRAITPAAVSSTSTVTVSLNFLRAVSASISATSSMSAEVSILGAATGISNTKKIDPNLVQHITAGVR